MNLKRLSSLQNVLQMAIDEKVIAGANGLVLHHGQEKYYFQAGLADIGNNVPIQRNTLFRLYSMSKPVTGAAVMILLERGLIDLLDPVSKYLPGFKNQNVCFEDSIVPVTRDVTIKDLLSMTSGLVYGGEDNRAGREATAVFEEIEQKLYSDSPLSTIDVANKLGHCTLAFQPGTHWCYGTSADILGAIVEVVSGVRFGDFLNENIFTPLNMNDTGFSVQSGSINRLAKVYSTFENGPSEYIGNHLGIAHDMTITPTFESGGAGLVSTVDDFAKFTQMLLNGGNLGSAAILSPKTVKFFTTCHLNTIQQADMMSWDGLAGYSYGNLMRIMVDPGLAVLNGTKGEYGWDGWLGTYFFNDPKNDLTFLLMFQMKESGTIPLTRKLRNIVMSSLE